MSAKISVIVVIYNTPKQYLKKCIDSIINQTFKDIEIILVNDGSTSEIREICENYHKKDKRIKLINQENQGESIARNVGIKNVETEQFLFVDSDDWIEEDLCEKCYKYINKINFDYEIVLFNCYVDYVKKEYKNSFYTKKDKLNNEDIEQLQLQNIEKGIVKYYPPETNVSVPFCKIYKKEFIDKKQIEYISMVRMTDAVFNMLAFELANKIYLMDEYLYHYRKNEYSICQRYSEDTVKYYEKYFELVNKYIEKYNKNEKFKDTLNLKITTSIDIYMFNKYFHKDNPKDKKQQKEELRNLLKEDLYQKAFKNVKKEYLSKYQRAILMFAQIGNVEGLKILKKLKEKIKLIRNS